MIYLRHATLALLFALCLCAACRRGATVEGPVDLRTFKDGIGRQVVVKHHPQRIISLAPSVTETLFALGLADRIVGVTTYCDYPEGAKAKEKIGDTLRPDLERILALKPDLVVITTASQLETMMHKLDQLAIPVYVTNPRTVHETVVAIRDLGEVTGAIKEGAEIADAMAARVNQIENLLKSGPRPRVFYVLQNDPLITAGRNTFINDLINLAGGQSISGEETADYPQFSRETVVARAPEVIVAPSSHGTQLVSEADLRRDFATTPAVQLNRIVYVEPDFVDRPGPRLTMGLEQLAKGLHPEGPKPGSSP
ncbi:MAG TPA: cobalamin-binding protein [Blastocatellia bacterium]|nr:cobalamin-binding protein [Blastocatellia bacterium]